jgi:hypothetical protein
MSQKERKGSYDRVPHSHASRILLPGLTGRVLRWLAARMKKTTEKT